MINIHCNFPQNEYEVSTTDNTDTNHSFYDSWRVPSRNTATPTNNTSQSQHRSEELVPQQYMSSPSVSPNPISEQVLSKNNTQPDTSSVSIPLEIEIDPNAWELPADEFNEIVGDLCEYFSLNSILRAISM